MQPYDAVVVTGGKLVTHVNTHCGVGLRCPGALLNVQERRQKTDEVAIKGAFEATRTIVLISHDIHDVIQQYDHVVVMTNGQLVGSAKAQDVTDDDVPGMTIPGKCPPGAAPVRGPCR